MDDVIYLSEMTAEQDRLDSILRQRIESDDELRSASADFRALASAKPFGLSHSCPMTVLFWRMNYQYDGKFKTLAFGVWPETGLADAWAKRDGAR